MDRQQMISQALAEAVKQAVGGIYREPLQLPSAERLYGLYGIFCSIYLKGDLQGKASLFIREESAAQVVAAILGLEDALPEPSEVLDGMGEILNIIAGCFKTKMDAQDVRFEISVPSVRTTSVIPASSWENNVEHVFSAGNAQFNVAFSYRMMSVAEKAAAAAAVPKPKLTAADLLKMAMAKKNP